MSAFCLWVILSLLRFFFLRKRLAIPDLWVGLTISSRLSVGLAMPVRPTMYLGVGALGYRVSDNIGTKISHMVNQPFLCNGTQ
jgi:hypothetical protein